jgi:hypothetical protein
VWKLNVRFPESLRSQVDQALEKVNASPEQIGEVSKNDLIVHAVGMLCRQLLENDNSPAAQ